MDQIGPGLLGDLFDAHADALGLYARQWTDEPEDVVQEAFIRLAGQRKAPDRVVPWLYRVVRNGAIAASRGDRRRKRREALSAEAEARTPSADDRIDAEHAARLLDDLEPDTRGVVVARIWGGLTFEEVAEAQGCSLATAHRRYRAGLQRLHQRLERSWTGPESAPKTT